MPDEKQFSTCDHCRGVFQLTGDDWYQLDRMHDDRVGQGPLRFGSRACAIAWLSEQKDFRDTRHNA